MLVFVRSCATQNHLTFLQIMSCDKLARKYTTFLVDIQIKMPFCAERRHFRWSCSGFSLLHATVRGRSEQHYHTAIIRLSIGYPTEFVAELLLIFVSKETVF